MSEHYYKRMPRTLAEAFGPYTSSEIETGDRPRDPLWVRCTYWVICVLAVGLMLAQVVPK
jgi:hypothetical protein